jgi:hypothetical protein
LRAAWPDFLFGDLAIQLAVLHVDLLNPPDELLVREPVLLLQQRPESLGDHEQLLNVEAKGLIPGFRILTPEF